MSAKQEWEEAVKRIAAGVVGSIGQPQWGVVANVDPVGNRVRLIMQPDNVLSGWFPVLIQAAAAGNTDYSVPVVNSMAAVVADMGQAEHGIVVGFAHNDQELPPVVPNASGSGGTQSTTKAAAVSGERIIVANGSTIRLCTNGDIFLQPGSGNVHIDGNLVCNGDVSDRHGSLDRLRGNYDAHKHGGVQTGGGSTGTTDHIDSE